MRRPSYDMNVFRERRAALASRYPGAAFVLPAHPEQIRNNDVNHAYRQDTNLFYLTGFEEPGSVLVFRPGQDPESTLFVRPKDSFNETWYGFRYGVEGALSEFGVDHALVFDDFEREIVNLLRSCDRLFYHWNLDPQFDRDMLSVLEAVRSSSYRSGGGHLPVFDSAEAIGELRLFKSEHDIRILRRACEISANAHIEAMRFAKPGVNERQVMATLIHSFYMQGAVREGYLPIVAAGSNATTLHYIFNDQTCKDGDLLLIDAGAEFGYFAGDITRTFPVSGKFTEPQRRIYEPLLEIQKALVQMVRPGIRYRSLHEASVDAITELCLDLGLLKGTKRQNIDSQAYQKYYPHGVSHWLGMDVHDVGRMIVDDQPRLLEPGMALTIEPGLYVPVNDLSAPEELRGLGIRIEDDVVVTATGCENLTETCPKEIDDLEKELCTPSSWRGPT